MRRGIVRDIFRKEDLCFDFNSYIDESIDAPDPDKCKDQECRIHDPFYVYGLGVVTYQRIIRILRIYLFFMSILAIYQMILFRGVDEDSYNEDTWNGGINLLAMKWVMYDMIDAIMILTSLG